MAPNADIRIRILGGIRAALETDSVAQAMDRLGDQTSEAGRAAIRATLALRRLRLWLRKTFNASALASFGMGLFSASMSVAKVVATSLAMLALPALAIALWNVAVAATVVATAFVGGFLALAGAAGIMAVAVIGRFKQMSGVIGSAANDLQNAGYAVRGAFRDATAGGADAMMRGLARGLQMLAPLLRGLEGSFTALGGAFGTMFERFFGRISTMGPELQALFAALVPTIRATGNILATMFELLVQIGTVGAPLVTDAFKWLDKTLQSWLGAFTDGRLERAKTVLKDFAAGVKAFFSAFAAPIRPFFGDAMDEFGAAWKSAGPALGKILGTFVALMLQLGRAALPYVAKGLTWLGSQMPTVIAWFKKAGKAVGQVIKDISPFVENILWPLIKGIAKSVISVFAVVVKAIQWAAKALGWLGEKARPLRGTFETIGQIIGIVFIGPITKAIGAVGKLLGGMKGFGAVGFSVFSIVAKAIGNVGIVVARAVGWVARGIGAIGGGIGRLVGWVWGKLSGFQRMLATLAGGIATAAGEFWGGLKTAAASVFDWIGRKLRQIVQWVKDIPAKIKGGVTGALGGLGGVAGRAARAITGNAGGGTMTRGGLSWVGERGPELVALPAAATVFPSAQSRSIASADRPQRQEQRAAASPSVLQAHFALMLPNMRELARGVKEIELTDLALEG